MENKGKNKVQIEIRINKNPKTHSFRQLNNNKTVTTHCNIKIILKHGYRHERKTVKR